MRPVDQKLKYQVQKMMKIAASGKVEKNDPLLFRANPDAFDSDNETETAKDSNEGKSARKTILIPISDKHNSSPTTTPFASKSECLHVRKFQKHRRE